jgi:hypothetical protein
MYLLCWKKPSESSPVSHCVGGRRTRSTPRAKPHGFGAVASPLSARNENVHIWSFVIWPAIVREKRLSGASADFSQLPAFMWAQGSEVATLSVQYSLLVNQPAQSCSYSTARCRKPLRV